MRKPLAYQILVAQLWQQSRTESTYGDILVVTIQNVSWVSTVEKVYLELTGLPPVGVRTSLRFIVCDVGRAYSGIVASVFLLSVVEKHFCQILCDQLFSYGL